METFRDKLIARMHEEFAREPYPLSGRFNGFYVPETGDDKRSRKYNARQEAQGCRNLNIAHTLSDEELLDWYDIFTMKRFRQR